MIDAAATALGEMALKCLAYDLGDRCRGALDSAGKRVAAERAEPNRPGLWALAVLDRQAVIVDHDQHAVSLNDRPGGSEIERDDGDAFLVNVEPDIKLGPIREREDPDALAFSLQAIVEPPWLWALTLGIPMVMPIAEREHALLGA